MTFASRLAAVMSAALMCWTVPAFAQQPPPAYPAQQPPPAYPAQQPPAVYPAQQPPAG